jgi:adenosylcobinamide kinase / adenosylcobinamide-phosphate guanylyltransferase
VITLVLGGARSGKSAVAERLVSDAVNVTYIATGVPTDADMTARITAHQARRPATWTTVECGDDLVGALRSVSGPALVDGLGTWVARQADFAVDTDRLCDALASRDGNTVVVSDEVGLGVHPSTEVGRRFRDALGLLNQAVAASADQVLLVVAGRVLPLERVR